MGRPALIDSAGIGGTLPPSPTEVQGWLHTRLAPGIRQLIALVQAEALQQRLPIYLVGGFVRDLLLGLASLDLDFTLEGEAPLLVRALAARWGGAAMIHLPFHTATWTLPIALIERLDLPMMDGEPPFVDLVTARREIYSHPGALPSVTPGTLAEDLFRRDFTINALAIAADSGQLIDQYQGLADLSWGLLRVMHERSFQDDPTRIFRGVRFEQRFGFGFEPQTEALIAPALVVIDRVSGDRLRVEFERIFHEPAPESCLIRLDELAVLRQIDPELHADEWLRSAVRALDFLVNHLDSPLLSVSFSEAAWTLLLCRADKAEQTSKTDSPQAMDNAERIARRLKVRHVLVYVEQVRRALAFLLQATSESMPMPSAFVQAIEPIDPISLAALWAACPLASQRAMVMAYATHWRFVKPLLNGGYLQQMGLLPGPTFGMLLRRLRGAVLDGLLLPEHSAEHERILIRDWLRQEQIR